MRNVLIYCFHLLLFFNCYIGSANNEYASSSVINGFIENKGQIVTQTGEINSDVHYIANYAGFNFHITKNGFSYEVSQKEKNSEVASNYPDILLSIVGKDNIKELTTKIITHRIDIRLKDCNKNYRIEQENPLHYYEIYYTSEREIRVQVFNKITYKNIYENIDLEFITLNDGSTDIPVKYNFIIHPGGNPDLIQLEYIGQLELNLRHENTLALRTRFGNIIDNIPKSYTKMNNEYEDVKVEYNVRENIISFKTGKYDKNADLIIDPVPTRNWGTYYGGTGDEQFSALDTDASGNLLVGGYSKSATNIATAGSHQNTLAGVQNGCLVKFNSSGVRQWATYYGAGAGFVGDRVWGLTVDASNNIIITGYTSSSTAISTAGSHQVGYGGGFFDAYIAKFNSSGVRQWGTYYGGTGTDSGFDVETDASENIFVSGLTSSSASISTAGSHQNAFGGGASGDGYLVKFNSSGVRQWATYYGGVGDDALNAVILDASNNIFVSGSSSTAGSAPNAIATAGAHQTSFGGAISGGGDAILVKFNSSGVRQWGTYYGGNEDEVFLNLNTDQSNNIIVSGYTFSASAIASAGAHQTSYGGAGDVIVVKFNNSGVRQWGTYYGGTGREDGWGLAIDNSSGNIYIAGNTGTSGSAPNAISTSGSYQTSYGGGVSDCFMTKFNSSGVRQWGTYYGGTGIEGNWSKVHYNSNNIYMIGYTSTAGSAPNAIASSGAHQTSLSGGEDGFVAQFSDNPCGACSSGGSGTTWTWTGCLSADWFNVCNWDRQSVPTSASDVIIPNTTNKPLITAGTGNCNTIEIQTSGRLDLDSNGGGILNVAQ